MRFNRAMREKGVGAKVCGKCFVVKGLEAFSFKSKSAGSRMSKCRACTATDTRRWREKNPDRARQWRDQNRERVAEANRRWYMQNRERVAEAHRQWCEQNRERVAEANRQWYMQNREWKAEYDRQWRQANPDKHRDKAHRRRARLAAATIEPFTPADLYADWQEHGLYACFFCAGPAEPLHVEHFYPLKPADESATPGPHALFNLVPACQACNLSKGNREPWAFLRDALAERGIDLDACLAFFDVD